MTVFPVIWNRQLVGLLTAENVGELYMIRRALSGRAGSRPGASPLSRSPRVIPPLLPGRQSGGQDRIAPTWPRVSLQRTNSP